MGRVDRVPGRYYSVHDDTMQGLANAVRGLRYIRNDLTPAEMEAEIRKSKIGIDVNCPHNPEDHIDPVTGKWVRPPEYPDLDSIDMTDFEGVYLTYDLRKTPGYAWIGLCVINVTNNTYFNVERGHLENGVFVADYTVRRQSTSSTAATSPRFFRERLDEANGMVQLWRVRTEGHIASVRFAANTTTTVQNFQIRQQPCVERVGRLPYVTSIASSSSGSNFALAPTTMMWATYWLERDKVALGGAGNCTSFSYAYNQAYNLQELDMSGWNTSAWNVTTLTFCFAYCFSLRNIDLSSWNTSGWTVTTAASMFAYCYSLKKVDMSVLDTTSWAVTSLASMFYNCYSMEFADLRCDTKNWRVTTLASMFYQCMSLVAVDMSTWDTSEWAVTTLASIFYVCYALERLDLSIWDTENWAVTTIASMFQSCLNLKELSMNWDTSNWKVTTLASSFRSMFCIKELDFSSWNTSGWAVTTLANCFETDLSLEKLDLTAWDTSNWAVTTYTEIFRYCRALLEVDAHTWDVSGWNVTVVRYAFEDTGNLRIVKWPVVKYNGTATNLGTGFPVGTMLQEWHGYDTNLAMTYSGAMHLTPESLVDILTNLREVSATTTITLGQYNKLKLTAEQLAIATDKGWKIA